MIDIEQQKKAIRQTIRQRRQSISNQQAHLAGQSLYQQLCRINEFINASTVGCFWSFDGEIDTQPVLKGIADHHKRCVLPYLRPSKPNRLWFLPYQPGEPMAPNRLGIPEVMRGIDQAVRVSQIDLLLMPLVAFDIAGNRLGMGGGFYDATLQHLNLPEFQKNRPFCLGMAFECQKVPMIPEQPWDYPLDGVITESAVYRFAKR